MTWKPDGDMCLLQVTLDVDETLSTHVAAVHWLISTVSCSSCQYLTLRFAWEGDCLCWIYTYMPSQAQSGRAVSKAVLALPSAQLPAQRRWKGGQPVPSPRAGSLLAPIQLSASSPGDPVGPASLWLQVLGKLLTIAKTFCISNPF